MDFQEGYYVTAFVCIDELQNLLDIKLRHDQAIALWKYVDGKITLVRYWELERLSGIKEHPKALFNNESFDSLLNHLLYEVGVNRDQIIGIWGTKGLEEDTRYRDQFETGIAFHNIAHLLTAVFYGEIHSQDDTVLAFALDAGPDSQFEPNAYEMEYYAGGLLRDGKLTIFDIESPARLWSYAKKKLKLREGTLMALASATTSEYYNDMSDLEKYSFTSHEARDSATTIIDNLYRRIFSLSANDIGIECTEFDNNFSDDENRISMLMKIVSDLSEQIVYRNIDKALVEYNIDYSNTVIGFAGGFALNCPTNSAVLNKYSFKSYRIPPCTSDTGIAMGIGLALFYPLLINQNATVDISHAYYGDRISDTSMELATVKYANYIKSVDVVSLDDIVHDIIDKSVIVWVNRSAEIGPRALGNRSLIADPRYTKTKDKLNEIKKREWWRPVAPMILEEFGKDYFVNFRPSPNMLLNFNVIQSMKDKIPAVMHLDGTARAQTVSPNSNPNVYKLIETFNETTGVPILCNTSLNDAGEPIINTVDEAIEFALHKGFDAVYCNGQFRINLKHDSDQIGRPASLRNWQYFTAPGGVDVNGLIESLNPHKLTTEELTYYFDNPGMFKGLHIDSEADAEEIRVKTRAYVARHPTALIR